MPLKRLHLVYSGTSITDVIEAMTSLSCASLLLSDLNISAAVLFVMSCYVWVCREQPTPLTSDVKEPSHVTFVVQSDPIDVAPNHTTKHRGEHAIDIVTLFEQMPLVGAVVAEWKINLIALAPDGRKLFAAANTRIETTMGLSNGALRGILGRALGTLRRMPALRSNP